MQQYRPSHAHSSDEQQMMMAGVTIDPGMMHILSQQHLMSSQEESKDGDDQDYDEDNRRHLDLMFSPYNLQDKSRGALRLNHHQTANNLIGPMSEGGNSASSFSGSGQKHN